MYNRINEPELTMDINELIAESGSPTRRPIIGNVSLYAIPTKGGKNTKIHDEIHS